MLKIANVRVALEDDRPLQLVAAQKLKVPQECITSLSIVRRAIDARRKNNISFVYTFEVETSIPEGKILAHSGPDIQAVQTLVITPIQPGDKKMTDRPVIVGAGPAGLLAALTLAEYGYRPLLLERGRTVEQRSEDVARFWQTGQFEELSNVQFGEGGAGTFSDGKLTTRVNDPCMGHILKTFVAAGAPPEIIYQHKPHVGTDMLRTVVKNIRNKIIKLGGDVRFEAHVTDIIITDNEVTGVKVNGEELINCQVLVLAIGHSARDTYEMLLRREIALEAKPFAIGVRIEHPQSMIDKAQYGNYVGHPKLGPADYSLVFHDKKSGRTAYSFCMCPGGVVVGASSEIGGVVTNGMSAYHRNSGIANSALVVNVDVRDFGLGPLAGVYFQRHYEQQAFALGGRNYSAPIQTVGDFLQHKAGQLRGLTQPSYRPGVKAANLADCLPDFVVATLGQALPDFQAKIRDFANSQAVMTGVETRTSAPVRILRSADCASQNTRGLYPAGEGAGYAGGIMSAALDGMNCALSIIQKWCQ